MLSLISGLIIGLIMGLTGAGGALVALPLFMTFFRMDLKEASVYSLLAVIIASLLNFIFQRKYAQYLIGIGIILFSGIGSYFSTELKTHMDLIVMKGLIVLISLYALYNVWRSKNGKHPEKNSGKTWLVLPVGLLLGVVTTLTGLGGGVLMMPILLKFFPLNQNQAVSTSLLAVGMSSFLSLIIQVQQGAQFEVNGDIFLLVLGILLSAAVIQVISKKLPASKMVLLRQIVFTGVVAIALLKISQ